MKLNWRINAALAVLSASFLVMVLYIYAYLVVVVYIGFTYDGSNGLIYSVDVNNALLKKEDVIDQVNGVPWKEYTADRTGASFTEYHVGDIVPLVVRRGVQTIPVAWPVVGPRVGQVAARVISTMLIGPFFWLFGAVAFWVIRPRDVRWFLLVVLYATIAAWAAAGTCSAHRVWYSSIVLRALTWPLVAVLLHYHWTFPRPLGNLPYPLLTAIYSLAGVMLALEIAQVLPRWAYSLALLLGLAVSAGLLIAHAVRQPDSRRDLRILAVMFLSLIAGAFSLVWLGDLLHQQNLFVLTIAFLPLIPLAYFYLAYRRQLGGMQARPSRWMGFLLYAQGLVTLAALVLGATTWLTSNLSDNPSADLLAGSGLILLLGLGGTVLYPRFLREFERRILGISLPPDEMVAAYARQIAASPDRERLRAALERDIFPSLMIRQAAVWYFPEVDKRGAARRVEPVIRLGLTEAHLPALQDLSALLPEAVNPAAAPDWVHLALPLEYRELPIGLALFGRRDPDDEYNAADLSILRALLAQTALAVVNTDQAALLHALQRHEIERQEAERARLGRDLHDEVLNQLALASHYVDRDNTDFHEIYEAVTDRIRNIMGGLRPVTLERLGLYMALTELQDDLYQRISLAGSDLQVHLDLPESPERYPAEVELAIYRIVQQASLNALAHAQAAHLTIGGALAAGQIDLCVTDDGSGFQAQAGEWIPMLVHGHYGMLNMHERAALVGARLNIDSTPGQGTRVCVAWSQAA